MAKSERLGVPDIVDAFSAAVVEANQIALWKVGFQIA